MKLESALRGARRIYMDTAPLVYWLDTNPAYIAKMDYIVGLVESKQLRVFTSSIALTELMVRPLRLGNVDLAQEYYDVLDLHKQFSVLLITHEVAISAAAIRARYRLRTPDALHAASALLQRCDAFLTNDSDFRRVQDLNVLVLDDLEL